MKVRIKKLGNLKQAAYGGQQPDGALDVTPTSFGGSMASAQEGVQVQKTLTREPREDANLEAEGGETAFGPISGDTIPDHMVIKGPRHSSGGVPLNLPDDTFIFSDTRKMKISDPSVLAMFGKKKKKGGYTPADLAKPYDIQKYKAILMDPESDDKAVSTAQMMIQNYVLKLGALALAQEAKKGFPQGIPEMARPYMEANGIADEDLLPEQPQQEQQPQQPQQPMEQMPEMQMQPPMAFGGYSDLNRFVEGGDPTLAFNNGTVQGATAMDRLENAIYSEENLDNLTVDQLSDYNARLLEEDPLSDEEFTPPPPPTPEEIASGEDTEGGKASYKWKNKFEANKPEIARRANMAMAIGANLVNEYDRRRIAARSERASYDEPARQKDSRGMYGANTGREALRNMEESEMIVGQDYAKHGGSMMDYAMSMGGSYFPTMATGGFTQLNKFAGDEDSQVGDDEKKKKDTRNMTEAELRAHLAKVDRENLDSVTACPEGYVLLDGLCVRGSIGQVADDKDLSKVAPVAKENLAKDESKFVKDMCQSMKTGSWVGWTAQQLADKGIIGQSAVATLSACETDIATKEGDEVFEAKQLVEEVELCQCKDENGEPLQPQPEPDPETGKCPCPTYDETTGEEIIVEEEPYIDDPHWSDVATRGVYTAAMMDPGVERPQLATPDRVETRPVYEDYLAKVQAIQAGVTTAADSVNKTAGSTSDKMAMLSQLVGQASPAAANAVAETQARNIGYQDAANARQLQADSNYANAVADVRGRQSMLNADAANTYRTNRNVKAANVQEQVAQAEGEMAKRQQMNTMYPQYASEYHKGFIYPTGRGKTPVPEKPVGIEDYAAMLAQAKGAFQDDELARKYVEAQMGIKSQYGGQAYKKGGSVKLSSFIPTYKTMPYGN